jgi:hypothetical protein
MHASSLFAKNHIEAIIDKNPRRRTACALQGVACESSTLFPGEVFLPNLNPIDASLSRYLDLL